jgi:hypothetical protein
MRSSAVARGDDDDCRATWHQGLGSPHASPVYSTP